MSRSAPEVFQLGDPEAEDYLNFGNNEAASSLGNDGLSDYEMPMTSIVTRGKKKGKGKSAAPRGRSASTKRQCQYDDDDDGIMNDWQLMQRQKAQASLAQTNARATLDEEGDAQGASVNKKIPTKQVAEHQQLILCLQRYSSSQRFAPMLRNAGLKLINLETKSVAELKDLQTRVRTICCSGGGANGWLGTGILVACGGVEKVTEKKVPKHVMDLSGFQNSLQADPEYDAVCEMIELDMGWASSMTPMQRLGLCLGKHAYQVNHMNQQRNNILASLIAQQHQQQRAPNPVAVLPVVVSAVPVSAEPVISNPPAAQGGAISMYENF